jgi:hypothetical protein
MKNKLNEGLPALIPEYPIEVAGHHLTLRFDVNINKTKKGVKLQFVMKDVPEDPREAQTLANEIGSELQQRFGDAKLQIMYDVENPYKNVIGFLLPLPSLASYMMQHVLKGGEASEVPQPEPEDNQEELPAEEVPGEEEPMKEMMMWRAGIGRN